MDQTETAKRKQRPKKGRVVRISEKTIARILTCQRRGETITATIDRLYEADGHVRYVLPSDLHETVSDARGTAVLRALRQKTKKTEKPIPVKV